MLSSLQLKSWLHLRIWNHNPPSQLDYAKMISTGLSRERIHLLPSGQICYYLRATPPTLLPLRLSLIIPSLHIRLSNPILSSSTVSLHQSKSQQCLPLFQTVSPLTSTLPLSLATVPLSNRGLYMYTTLKSSLLMKAIQSTFLLTLSMLRFIFTS